MTSASHSGGGNSTGRKSSFGNVRKLPSGRWQARYTGPDGREYKAPTTFQTKSDAQTWLSLQHADITREKWLPATTRSQVPDLSTLAQEWLTMPRTRPLKPRTASHYRALLDRFILPTFGATRLSKITPEAVDDWFYSLPADRPTYRAHAYSLLRTLMGYAITKKYIAANPCTIAGAGTARRRHTIEPATLNELAIITEKMPQRYRAMVLLAAWCALRFGELTELRRKDIDLDKGVVNISRAVTHVDGTAVIGAPKSEAGVRQVAIPPHLTDRLKDHLKTLPRSREALLFPAADGQSHMKQSSLAKVYYPARRAAGRSDLRFHDLRHTGATLAAQTGATLAELMGRLGHSTPQAALIYQHKARGRDAEIAAALSEIAGKHTQA